VTEISSRLVRGSDYYVFTMSRCLSRCPGILFASHKYWMYFDGILCR